MNRLSVRILALTVLCCVFLMIGGTPAAAQVPWSSGGNQLLNGEYAFRHVAWAVNPDTGAIGQAVTLDGFVVFDGQGNYTLNAVVLDSLFGQNSTSQSGTYRIAASGLGWLESPVQNGGRVWGMVSQGVFIGSSTESQLNDFFVAAPALPVDATTASLNGSYWIADMNFPGLSPNQARNSLYRMDANGQGQIGRIDARGHIGGNTASVNQTINQSSYVFADGQAVVTFGGVLNNQRVLAGTRILNVTPDGNFVFGGSPDSWDFFVGVRAPAGAVPANALDGRFYQAGFDVERENLSNNRAFMNSYYGALSATGGGSGSEALIAHQRLFFTRDEAAYNYTYSDFFNLGSDGFHDDFLGFLYVLGADGRIRIGFGDGDIAGINVGFRAPDLSGNGVFLNPAGIVNAASFTPFTVGVSKGQLVTIYGTGLANSTALDTTFPTILNGVQVLIGNRPAHIYAVSPERISAVVPFDTELFIASVRVINNGQASNEVTTFVNETTPGVFTNPANGVGFAAAQHGDYSDVTPANPASPGETIAIYMTGLGAVEPAIPDGTPGPTNPLSETDVVVASVDGKMADVSYSGLAPNLIGLYQMNIKIPEFTLPGDAFLEIGGPDAVAQQGTIPVAGAGAAAAQRLSKRHRMRGRPSREATKAGRSEATAARRIELPR